jgi:hypothetical protein
LAAQIDVLATHQPGAGHAGDTVRGLPERYGLSFLAAAVHSGNDSYKTH